MLLLRHQGWSTKQIAAHAGISTGRVSQLVCQAALTLLKGSKFPWSYNYLYVRQALWVLWLRDFNRAVARRGLERARRA